MLTDLAIVALFTDAALSIELQSFVMTLSDAHYHTRFRQAFGLDHPVPGATQRVQLRPLNDEPPGSLLPASTDLYVHDSIASSRHFSIHI